MTTIGICDDCAEQVEVLKQTIIGLYGGEAFEFVTAVNPYAFLELAIQYKPALVFLDIDMAGLNGIALGEQIKAARADTVIVYVTAHEKYALEAFRVRAFHYLLKPLTKDAVANVLCEALKVIQSARAKPRHMFTLQRRGATVQIPYADIFCFEKTGHKIRVHMAGGTEEYYGNIADLLLPTGNEEFIQCHQGYIVNISKVRAFRDKTLYLDGGVQAPVSRSFADSVRDALSKRLFAAGEEI